MYCSLTFTLLILLIAISSPKQSVSSPPNPCISKKTCHDCIQTLNCAWCSMPNFNGRGCFHRYDDIRTFMECTDEYIFYPESVNTNIRFKELSNKSFDLNQKLVESTDKTVHNKYEIIQFYPQEIILKLRISKTHRINIEYLHLNRDVNFNFVELKDTSNNYINIKYYSSCLGGWPITETNKCRDLNVGDHITFVAEVVIHACPKNRSDWNQKFMIYPVGTNKSLTVNLEMICDCPCENTDHKEFEASSIFCSNIGDLSCGICLCPKGFYGEKCECHRPDLLEKKLNETSCRQDNRSIYVCSGRGICQCGLCECNIRSNINEQIYGPYCECDNYSCERRNGLLCSGLDRGICDCGICLCKLGWTGPACEYSSDANS